MRAPELPGIERESGQDELRATYLFEQFVWRNGRGLIHHQKEIGLLVFLQQNAVAAVVMYQGPIGVGLRIGVIESRVTGHLLGSLIGDVLRASGEVDTEGTIERPAKAVVVHMAADADECHLRIGFHIELVLGHVIATGRAQM